MPWPNLAQQSDDDLKAIFAYLRSIPAIRNDVPAPKVPDAVMDGIAASYDKMLKKMRAEAAAARRRDGSRSDRWARAGRSGSRRAEPDRRLCPHPTLSAESQVRSGGRALFEVELAVGLDGEAAAAARRQPDVGALLGQPLAQQDQPALEVVAQRRQAQRRIQAQLAVGELAAAARGAP